MGKATAVLVVLLGLLLSGSAEAQRYGGGFRSVPAYRPSYTPRPAYRPSSVPRTSYQSRPARPATNRPAPYTGHAWTTYSALLIWLAVANNSAAKPNLKPLGEIPCRDLIARVKRDGSISKEEGRVLLEWTKVTGKRLDSCR